MKKTSASIILILVVALFFSCKPESKERASLPEFDTTLITEAQNIIGLRFDTAEQSMMKGNLSDYLESYEGMREVRLENSVSPALIFMPLKSKEKSISPGESQFSSYPDLERPDSDIDLAFMTVAQLSWLYKTGQVSSLELTNIYLARLKEHNDSLNCLVTLTENLALEQARQADKDFAAGIYHGPLHGIPYGVKDLLAVEGYKTTWGARPFENQLLDETATVVKKLEEAGAVLIAKLSMGALAMGDRWFGGRTNNPWNISKGSSGSSAGSASATSAGLLAFAIGTETLGSIVSPSTRCGVTGLRPTFGAVSRTGAMALSWSMDKIGPICRSAEDCAIVFDAIRGEDGLDLTVTDSEFAYDANSNIDKLRIGYFENAFNERRERRSNSAAVLKEFRKMGIKPTPVNIEFEGLPVESMGIILTAEASAAFDELTREDLDTLLSSQMRGSWPNTFRSGRFIPAVEYIQANRHRSVLMAQMENLMKDYDVIITPSFGGDQLSITNLTGHPCVVVPNGFDENGNPTSISFIGALNGEADIIRVASKYQEATKWDEMHPPLFSTK
jgi:Asp-tRNA(Asn)/Glu-tRNA(Gln) amidotransferase A subunit family amidase